MKICMENSLLTSRFGGTMPSSVIGRLTGRVVRLPTGIFSRQLEPLRYLPSQPEPLHLIEGGETVGSPSCQHPLWFREPEPQEIVYLASSLPVAERSVHHARDKPAKEARARRPDRNTVLSKVVRCRTAMSRLCWAKSSLGLRREAE
jgi:hypothetical protein